jgi:hypothetical protein
MFSWKRLISDERQSEPAKTDYYPPNQMHITPGLFILKKSAHYGYNCFAWLFTACADKLEVTTTVFLILVFHHEQWYCICASFVIQHIFYLSDGVHASDTGTIFSEYIELISKCLEPYFICDKLYNVNCSHILPQES